MHLSCLMSRNRFFVALSHRLYMQFKRIFNASVRFIYSLLCTLWEICVALPCTCLD